MISFIIVHYKTYDYTKNVIDSILKYMTGVSIEIVLVDNASFDGSVDTLKNDFVDEMNKNILLVIESEENKGFGYGNNMGFKVAKGEYIVLINSDAELTGPIVQNTIEYLSMNTKVGAVTARLINEHGKLDEACKRGFPDPKRALYYYLRLGKLFPSSSRFNQYKLNHLDEHKKHDVDAISGAFMVLPKRVLNESGYFDEEFFMYGEDLDLCFRIKEKGYRIVYNPTLGNVIHYKGQSGKKLKLKTTFEFYRAMLVFYNKHYMSKYPKIVGMLVTASIWILFCFKMTFGQIKSLLSK